MRDVLEAFFKLRKPTSYLEIGLGDGRNFESVPLEDKVCISPNGSVQSGRLLRGTSDGIFAASWPYNVDRFFEMVFIDGFHSANQVTRDLSNVLLRTQKDSVILIHDVNPFYPPYHEIEERTLPEKLNNGHAWMGNVWKIIFEIHNWMEQLDYVLIKDKPGWLVAWYNDQLLLRDEYINKPSSNSEMLNLIEDGTIVYYPLQEAIQQYIQKGGPVK